MLVLTLSVNEIQDQIPERAMLLMVDQVIDQDENTMVAHRKIQKNDAYFKGHFPSEPVVPGVLLVEGLKQTASLFLKAQYQVEATELVALQRVKFRKMVSPESELIYQIQLIAREERNYVFKGTVSLEGKKACQAKITLTAKASK